eukprot:PLAT10457.1.p2 GENE.PLAT10457.1~~PLAT10457.1.p2  ORF type:complete len:300 (+),score=109.94 PLAT10457.1:1-900(+)
MASLNGFNPRSTAVKRIAADIRELRTDPSDQYSAAPCEDNLFDWHFTIRGPRDTAFEGGMYHGRILLPHDYPFKPPNIIILTPNGRFQVRKKICLSISAYHPEEWQAAWGVRTILEALISFMPSPGAGAIGALDYTDDERRKLAKRSVTWKCPTCGPIAALLPELKEAKDGGGGGGSGGSDSVAAAASEATASKYREQVAKLHMHAPTAGGGAEARAAPAAAPAAREEAAAAAPPAEAARPVAAAAARAAGAAAVGRRDGGFVLSRPKGDDALTAMAWLLALAIAGILSRKLLRHWGAI